MLLAMRAAVVMVRAGLCARPAQGERPDQCRASRLGPGMLGEVNESRAHLALVGRAANSGVLPPGLWHSSSRKSAPAPSLVGGRPPWGEV